MPELPEVEAGRRVAERVLLGRRILRVQAANDTIVYHGISPRQFAAALRGRTVEAVCRRGKYLWFELDRRPWPVLHFGMTGSFRTFEKPADRPPFWKLMLEIAGGTRLAMINKRRLGRIRLQADPRSEPPVAALGFDPLLDMPPPGPFIERVARRNTPIKALLLDQSFAAGVGNWIADEVLYQAGIAPGRRACDLPPEQVRRLRTCLGRIVRRAVAVDADKARFPRTWLFHRRWGRDRHATTVRGEPIVHDTIAGRTTAWVPAVQS